MNASRSDTRPRLFTVLAGLSAFLLLVGLSGSPSLASSSGLGSTVSAGFVAEVASQSLVLQQQTRRRSVPSQPSSSSSRGTSPRTRSAPPSTSSSSSRATSSRRRTNTDSYRGGSRTYRGGSYYRGGGYYRGYRHYYPYYYPYYSYPYFSSYYWWGPSVYYGYRMAEDYGQAAGALDLDIKPEEAEVWIDGEYIGIADNYDGFPRYLWLPEGDHRLVFYLDGYRTAAREFTVSEGIVLQVKTKLERGESKPAAEFFPKPTKRAEARKKADEERRSAWRYQDRDRDDEDHSDEDSEEDSDED